MLSDVFLLMVFTGGLFLAHARQQTTPPVKKPSATSPTDNVDFAEIGEKVIEGMADGNFAKVEAMFSPEFQKKMPVAQVEENWKGLIGELGAFEGIVDTAVSPLTQGYRKTVMNLAFAKTNFRANVLISQEGRVVGIQIVPAMSENASPLGGRPSSWIPPEYVDAKAFRESSIVVKNVNFELPGFLCMPNGAGPFPGVVLVHDTSPRDADETLGPNKPFKDFAWGLASHGIAVLRYEKRTHKYGMHSSPNPDEYTVEDEVISDARAAVALLAGQKGVNAKRIFVVGHGLGAMLAPRIALGDPGIAGLVLLAGNTRPISQVILDQTKYLASLQPPGDHESEQNLAAARESAREIEDPTLKPGMRVNVMGEPMPSSYWLDLRPYKPAETAAALKIPILVLQGGKDFEVGKMDFAAWQEALKNHPNDEFKFYPDLNHYFVEGARISSPDEYRRRSHVSPQPISDVAKWIQDQSR